MIKVVLYFTLQISAYPTRYINKTWNCSKIHLESQKVEIKIYFVGFLAREISHHIFNSKSFIFTSRQLLIRLFCFKSQFKIKFSTPFNSLKNPFKTLCYFEYATVSAFLSLRRLIPTQVFMFTILIMM